MIKYLLAFGLCLCCIQQAMAIDTDSTVTITSAQTNCRFVFNSKTQQVEIKQRQSTSYIASAYQVTVPIGETYNSQISIDEVSCKVNGRTPGGFQPRYTYLEQNDVFYSDAQICYFPMMLDKKGSTGVTVFEQTIKDPRYFTSIMFSEPYAVQQKDVSIKVPRWMHLELKEMNFDGYAIKKDSQYLNSEDADLITYHINNLPAIKREENSPGPTYLYPHLLVMCKFASINGKQYTYFNTLADQYAWYHELTQNIGQNTDALKIKASEITTGLSSDIDKIKAIFYWVQGNVRYIAFEDGMAGFKPEKADEVMRKKYGDCKGMANLTKSLLTALGFDARLCWLGTYHLAYSYQTPCLAVDNHMICALKHQGKTLYLDATETNLGLNEYAERIQGRQVLMENGDQFVLTNIPSTQVSQNYAYRKSTLNVNGTSLTGQVAQLWKGEDKESVLSGLSSVRLEKADEAMMAYLSGSNGDYQISHFKLSERNPDKDLTVSYTLEYKKAVSSFDKALYIDLDAGKEMMSAKIAPERTHEYWFGYKNNICTEAELILPENYRVSYLPKPLHIIQPNYEFHIQYANQPGKLSYKKTIIIKNIVLAKTGFAQWNKDIEQLIAAYNETVILKPAI
jgi:hypothetical protein